MQSHSAHATDPPPGEPNNTQHRIEELERQVGEIQEEVKEMQTTFNLLRVSLRKLEDDLNRRNAEYVYTASYDVRTSLTLSRAHNADAKAYNATIVDMGNLLPLHDLATNKPIDGFPKNVAAIRNMEGRSMIRTIRVWC
jgi:septation ring formation regulator EzrA